MHAVHEILGSGRPLRNPQLVELGQEELAHVAGRNHVRKEQPDHLAPDHMLATEAKIPFARRNIDIGLAQGQIRALVALHRGGIEIVFKGIGSVHVGTRAQLPLDPGHQLAAGVHLAADPQLRPVRGIREGIGGRPFHKTADAGRCGFVAGQGQQGI